LTKKNGGFDCYFKTAVKLSVFCLAHGYPAAKTTVFFMPLGGGALSY